MNARYVSVLLSLLWLCVSGIAHGAAPSTIQGSPTDAIAQLEAFCKDSTRQGKNSDRMLVDSAVDQVIAAPEQLPRLLAAIEEGFFSPVSTLPKRKLVYNQNGGLPVSAGKLPTSAQDVYLQWIRKTTKDATCRGVFEIAHATALSNMSANPKAIDELTRLLLSNNDQRVRIYLPACVDLLSKGEPSVLSALAQLVRDPSLKPDCAQVINAALDNPANTETKNKLLKLARHAEDDNQRRKQPAPLSKNNLLSVSDKPAVN